MDTKIILIFFFVLLFGCKKDSYGDTEVSSNAYYVDSANGADSNDGLSPEKAWQTLAKVNSQEFKPGDRILFKSGCKWIGQLRPKGSGIANHPIIFDQYGEGPLPKISQGDQSGVVLLLKNQDQWEINHLELSGGTPKPDMQVGGIHVQATTIKRVLKHVVIRNCVIRDILGSVKLYESCSIWVGVPGWNDSNGLTTGFDDVLIENNQIYQSDRCGILVWTTAGPGQASQFQKGLIPSKNVVIRNNLLEDIGGDAILVLGSDRPLVENNVVRRCCIKSGDPVYGDGYNPSAAAIWLHHCEKGIMQNNAVYDCVKLEKNNDGMAYDFDFNCNECILQYNYSRNNAGGFLLIMNSATNNIARYNISENDRSHVLFCVGSRFEMNKVYNNTFFIDSASSYIVPNAVFYNNIFMAAGKINISIQESEKGLFKNNCFAGNNISLKLESNFNVDNPQLMNPGKGGLNAEGLGSYSLLLGSPCLGIGLIIDNNGGKDILGNPVPQNSAPDLGAIQSHN